MLCHPRSSFPVKQLTGIAIGIVVLAAPIASSAQEPSESIRLGFINVTWDRTTKARIEAEFRQAVASKGIKVSAAEIAGAAQAAFDGGVEHEDSWEQQTMIRGCGPARQLCFVITCTRCGSEK